MGEAVAYARSLAKLLDAMKAQAQDDSIKTELVRVRSFARSQALDIELNEDSVLSLEGRPSDSMNWELRPLIEAMKAHEIGRITLLEDAVPKELLHLTILLGKSPPATENDPTIFDEARDLALWSVRIVQRVRHDAPSAQSARASELNALPPNEIAARAGEIATNVAVATASAEAGEVLSGLCLLFVAESTAPDPVRKAQWTGAFDKAATLNALQVAAGLLPDAGTESGVLRALLRRAGEEGAEVLIAHLPLAGTLTRRRIYFDAIVELRKGVPQLIDALGSTQWYVVRNAALLLGEMQAYEAEQGLGRLLEHHDVRVRIAAISALVQMDRPSSRLLAQSGISDSSAEVRRRAMGGFGQEKGTAISATPLLRALQTEKDPEVEVEILYALGRVASADAVQKLIRLCSQSGAADKPASYRIAAIEGLTVARRSAALPILKAMLTDSEPTVRATARNLIESVNAMAGSR